MSLEINLEDFPNLLSVFEEIERRELRRSFPSADPEVENLLDRERKPSAFTTLEGRPEGPNTDRDRRASEPVRQTLDVSQSRFRIHSAPPYLPVDRDTLLTDRRFTDAARNLSDEELAELYEDILKPLDFYAMLHERRKQS
ncbi:unnamed protein product [Porites lobata]|uniref:Uncharacterized protein n=1 Tax=Porites lobata TaxID=104759 RepID=A0ABN8NRM5_9CNID|nr:unnamed protein product [Porites lobata]